MSKFNIAIIDAVRAHYAATGAKVKVRYFADGHECAKEDAQEFTVTVTNNVHVDDFGTKMTIEHNTSETINQESAMSEETTVIETAAVETVVETAAAEDSVMRNAAGRKLPAERKGQVTKASILREKIREELASGSYDKKELIDWAVAELGFKRPLARVYVKNLTPVTEMGNESVAA